MRSWLLVLLAAGVLTAGGLKWWRGWRSHSPAADVATSSGSPSVGAESDEGAAPAPAPAPVAEDAAAPAVAGPAQADDASANEVERPGGSTVGTDAEARRKAEGLIGQAGKTTSPVEQAKLLTQALKSGALDASGDAKAYSDLLEANKRGLLQPHNEEMCLKVEVKKGDNLWLICKRLKQESQISATTGLVQLVNGLTSTSIFAGAKLKVPTQPVSILVEKSRFRLSVFVGDVMLKRYTVGIGKDNKTPEGKFTIGSRLVDPPWIKHGKGAIAPDNPENILGTRWLGFAVKENMPEASTFGIHGSRDESTIGKESSNGCVRMKNADVEELFEWVGEGVSVEIVP